MPSAKQPSPSSASTSPGKQSITNAGTSMRGSRQHAEQQGQVSSRSSALNGTSETPRNPHHHSIQFRFMLVVILVGSFMLVFQYQTVLGPLFAVVLSTATTTNTVVTSTDSSETVHHHEQQQQQPQEEQQQSADRRDQQEISGDHDRDDNNNSNNNGDNVKPMPDKMNIVLLYADDWTLKTLGAYNPVVKTPHLDEMGRNGMLFPKNCVTTSICWISRATLYTGMYAGRHRQLRISDMSMFDQTVMWNETLYPLLKKAGYHTGFIGKWHSPLPPQYRAMTFDYDNFYYGVHWEVRGDQLRHVTELNQHDALFYLDTRPKDQPFALTVSFFATHGWDGKLYPDQYMPQNYSEVYYQDVTIPVPKTATQQHWEDLPWFIDERNEGRVRWTHRYNTPEHFQVSMKRYYRMASEVDDACGAIIAKLKEQGVYNNTLFIFTTDNGNFHGEHGLADKWYPHEESIQVPLVIQDPRMPYSMRGGRTEEITLSIDLAPTILSAAGVKPPQGMQGRDMASLYLNPVESRQQAAANWRKDFFYEWNQGDPHDAEGHDSVYTVPAVFALISKSWKYFYWPHFKYEQLFNVETDPWEEFDVINTTAQTNQTLLEIVKERYKYLKIRAQSGHPV